MIARFKRWILLRRQQKLLREAMSIGYAQLAVLDRAPGSEQKVIARAMLANSLERAEAEIARLKELD